MNVIRCICFRLYRLNVRVRQIYGLTETAGITLIPKDSESRPGSSGTLMPHMQLKICDLQTNEVLGPGETGEICTKAPMIMKKYLHNAEASDNAFDEEGFFMTGDVGYYDKDGYLFIVDRIKELIKYKGFQVRFRYCFLICNTFENDLTSILCCDNSPKVCTGGPD